MATAITPQALRRRDAAAYLGVSPRTLDEWQQQGTGPRCLRLSSRVVLYRRADLDVFLSAHLAPDRAALAACA